MVKISVQLEKGGLGCGRAVSWRAACSVSACRAGDSRSAVRGDAVSSSSAQVWAGRHGCAGRRCSKGPSASVTQPVCSPWVPVHLQKSVAEGCIWSWAGAGLLAELLRLCWWKETLLRGIWRRLVVYFLTAEVNDHPFPRTV